MLQLLVFSHPLASFAKYTTHFLSFSHLPAYFHNVRSSKFDQLLTTFLFIAGVKIERNFLYLQKTFHENKRYMMERTPHLENVRQSIFYSDNYVTPYCMYIQLG